MPTVNVDDLYNEFSGKSIHTGNDANVDALYKEFSNATPNLSLAPAKPIKAAAPISGYTPEQSDALNAQYEKQSPVESSIATKLGSAVATPFINFWKNTTDQAKSGYDTYTKGFKDFSNNLPASGVGEIGLGALQMATSPLTGSIKTAITDPITQLTGNPDIGEKAGFIASSGLPIASVGKIVKGAIPSNKALSDLVETIGVNKLPEVLARMRDDKSLSLADVSLPVKQMAQKLVVTEGNHMNTFDDFVKNRVDNAKGIVEGAYNDTMGVPVNVLQKLQSLKQSAKDVGSKDINPAIANSKPVDLSGVIKNIDDQLTPGVQSVITTGEPLPLGDIKKELKSVKKYLTNDKSVRTDPVELNKFQSNLRARADDLLNSPSGKDRQLGYSLMNVRNRIVDAIDTASGGTYKTALSKYRDEKQIEDAFVKGAQITRNRAGTWDDRPEFWQEWINNASKEQISAAKEGARLAVDQQINGMRFGAKKGENIPEVEFNKQKLSLLFGKNEVEALAKKLQNQRDISDTNSKLIEGAQTAMRLKSNSKVDLPVEKPLSSGALATALGTGVELATTGVPGGIAGTMAVLKVLNKGKFKAETMLAKSKNNALTNLITSTGQERENLINTLSNYIPTQKPSITQKIRNLALPILPP